MLDGMAESRRSRSGSRAPTQPKTKQQRLLRAKELTERIDRRVHEATEMSEERAAIFDKLNVQDGVPMAEIGEFIGRSEQLVNKAVNRLRAKRAEQAKAS